MADKQKKCIMEKCQVYDKMSHSCGYLSSNFADNPDYDAPQEMLETPPICLHPEILDDKGQKMHENALEKAARNWIRS